jgi:hypothetical protein
MNFEGFCYALFRLRTYSFFGIFESIIILNHVF